MNISCHSKVLRIDNFIRGGVVKNSLSMNTSLMSKGTITGNVILNESIELVRLGVASVLGSPYVEWDLNFDVVGNKFL